jgi:hypothetical protein
MLSPFTLFVDTQNGRSLEIADFEPPRDRNSTVCQFDITFQPPPVVESSHPIRSRLIVEGNKSQGLKGEFAITSGSANAFNHQHESIEFELS